MSNSFNETLAYIKNQEKKLQFAEKTIKLFSIPEFKEVILNGLFVTEANDLIVSLGSVNITQEQRNNIINSLQAIGTLQNYLNNIIVSKGSIEKDIDDNRQCLNALNNE